MKQAKTTSRGSAFLIMMICFMIIITLVLFVGIHYAQRASAQTPAPEGAQASMVVLEVSPSKVMTIPKDEPQTLNLELRSVKSEAGEQVEFPKDDIRDKIIKGVVRYVKVGSRSVGQLVLTGIEKGSKKERLTANKYVHQWELQKDVIGSADSFKIRASRAELLAIFDRLAQPKARPVVGGKRGEASTASTKERVATTGGGTGNARDAATNYKPPTGNEDEPEIDVQITTDGCDVRIDIAQGVAIQQTRSITTENGKATDESECGDSSTRYKLVKSYACKDIVNESTGIVQAQYKWFYEKDSTRVEVSACEADAERFYKIVEERGDCEVAIDLGANRATPQTALVYTNGNNEKIQVRGCATSSTQASVGIEKTIDGCAVREIDGERVQTARYVYRLDGEQKEALGCTSEGGELITEASSVEGCSVRVDVGAGLAILQEKLVKSQNGVVVSEGECRDSKTTYVLERSYQCTDKVNEASGFAQAQYSLYYTKDGARIEAASCQPDRDVDRFYKIVEETAGCTVRIDNASKQAIVQARLVYVDMNGDSKEVRGCADSAETAALALEKTFVGCEIVYDRSGVQRQQVRYVYKLDGTTREALGCSDEDGMTIMEVVVSEGCEVRVDRVRNEAIQQKRILKMRGDEIVETGDCTDSDERYRFERDYSACSDLVERDLGVAYGQYSYYYVREGVRTEVGGECTPDRENGYKLVEDAGGCDLVADFDAGVMVVETRLVYVRRGGETMEVRGCAESQAGTTLALTKTTAGCAIYEVDGERVQTARFTYEREGKIHDATGCESDYGQILRRTTAACDVRIDMERLQAIVQDRLEVFEGSKRISEGECEDTTTSYTLKQDHGACEVAIDVNERVATAQYQYYYTMNGRKVSIDGCFKDEREVYLITEKVSTCTAKVELGAMKAHPRVILLYTNHEGKEVQVRNCGVATTVASVAIRSTGDGCSAVKDDTGLTKEQERLVYTLGGKTEQVRGCMPSGKAWWVQVDDCTLRTDKEAKKVVVQKRKIYFENGRETRKDNCTDSEKSYALVISYDTCSYVLDNPVRVGSYAYAQFEMWYEGDLGAKKSLQICQRDEEKRYKIQEALDSCPMDTDVVKGEVTVQSTLVYYDREGVKTEARGCEKSESYKPNPIAMTRNTSQCKLVHNFDDGYSKQTAAWIYDYKGGKWQGSYCLEFGDPISHQKIHTSGGRDICSKIEDIDDGTLTLQYRLQITIGGVSEYISPCTPDESSLNLVATTDGCTDPASWKHDLKNAVSYGNERHYYTRNSNRIYVTNCQEAPTRSYTHSHTRVGYQHNDAQLFDYPLIKVTIDTGSLSGVYTLLESGVLPGASQLDYTKIATVDEKTNKDPSYSGCTKIEPTEKFEHWKRSDESIYIKKIGTGTSRKSYVCETRKSPFAVTVEETGATGRHCRGGSSTRYRTRTVTTYYLRVQKFNTETREAVGSYSEIIDPDKPKTYGSWGAWSNWVDHQCQ